MKIKTKRYLILLLVLMLALCTLFACSQNDDGNPPPPNDSDNSDDELPEIDWEAFFGGFSSQNEPQFLPYADAKYGESIEITYHSDVTNADKHAMVTLPYGYDESKQYPVLYLLHGIFCNHKSWTENGNAKYIVQNLNLDKGIKEMILVSVNSIVNADEKAPSIFDNEYAAIFDKTGEDIVTSLMPYVNEHYSTLTDRENTAIAGFSMGGRETMLTAFAYPEKFGYVGAFSSAGYDSSVVSFSSQIPDFKTTEGYEFEYLMLAIGSSDYSTGHITRALESKLTKNGIAFDKKTYNGGHDFYVWKCALYDFAQKIFQTESVTP